MLFSLRKEAAELTCLRRLKWGILSGQIDPTAPLLAALFSRSSSTYKGYYGPNNFPKIKYSREGTQGS
jgi:hypothetical protein